MANRKIFSENNDGVDWFQGRIWEMGLQISRPEHFQNGKIQQNGTLFIIKIDRNEPHTCLNLLRWH